MPEAARQSCPNCSRAHDVSVYVSGQKLLCSCGLHFEVVRNTMHSRRTQPASPRAVDGTALPSQDPAISAPTVVKLDHARAESVSPVVPRGEPDAVGQALPGTAVQKALVIPGYELLEPLGKGGMGEVWRARQISLGRVVAIKVLSPDLAREQEFVARFEKEAAALATLSHPHIVQIIDRGAVDGSQTFYFAMEHIEGKALRDVMRDSPPGTAQALRYVKQICRAIEYAHGKGVIHRDLKPENILIDAGGSLKVVDFGLAGMRTADRRLNLTQTSTSMGTANYMAPEQRRDAKAVDERADLYSIGVILYELLTGELPEGHFKLPSERKPGIDPRVDKIVARSLEPDREARYPNATAMLVELETLISGLPVSAPHGGAAQSPITRRDRRLTELGRNTPRKAIAAIGILLGIAAGGQLARLKYAKPAVLAALPPEDPHRLMPKDTNAELGVEVRRSGTDFVSVEVAFQPGAAKLATHTGEWALVSGALRARVFGDGQAMRPRKFAVLQAPHFRAEGLVLETVVQVDTGAPPGYDADIPRAGIQLRSESGARLEFLALFKGEEIYRLNALLPDSEGALEDFSTGVQANDTLPEPAVNQPLRLRIQIEKGELSAFAGLQEPLPRVLRKKLPLGDVSGHLTLLCAEATCRFRELKADGRLAREEEPRLPGSAKAEEPDHR